MKTSIGTQIYTGIKIGVAAHVHGFITENVPSFTIWAKSLGAKNVELTCESAIETQKRTFSRRGVKQTVEDINCLKNSSKSPQKKEKRQVSAREKFKL